MVFRRGKRGPLPRVVKLPEPINLFAETMQTVDKFSNVPRRRKQDGERITER